MRVRVIGVGSPWGDDAAGLRVAQRLVAAGLPAGASAVACERPFPDLLEHLEGAEHVILVDALHGATAPGALRWLSRPALARGAATSSHGLGVVRVLELSDALRRSPLTLEILGIETGDGTAAAGCAAVEAAIGRACALIRGRLDELLVGASTAGG